LEYWRGLFE